MGEDETDTSSHIVELGVLADRVDNLLGALMLPIPDAVHVKAMKECLPDIRDRMRAVYVAVTGDDPWEDRPQ